MHSLYCYSLALCDSQYAQPDLLLNIMCSTMSHLALNLRTHRLSEQELTKMLGEMNDPAVRTWAKGSRASDASSTVDTHAHEDCDLVLDALCPDSVSLASASRRPSETTKTNAPRAAVECESDAAEATGSERAGGEGVCMKQKPPGRLDAMFATIATGTVIPTTHRSQSSVCSTPTPEDADASTARLKAGADSPPAKRKPRNGVSRLAAVFGRGKSKCARR